MLAEAACWHVSRTIIISGIWTLNVSSPFPSGRLQATASHRLDLEIIIGWLLVVFETPDEDSGAFPLSPHPQPEVCEVPLSGCYHEQTTCLTYGWKKRVSSIVKTSQVFILLIKPSRWEMLAQTAGLVLAKNKVAVAHTCAGDFGSSAGTTKNIWCEEKLIFTFVVVLQGMTIRPLVDLLAVKRKRESAPTVGEQIHIRVSDVSSNTHPELSNSNTASEMWSASRGSTDLHFYLNRLQVSPFPALKFYAAS